MIDDLTRRVPRASTTMKGNGNAWQEGFTISYRKARSSSRLLEHWCILVELTVINTRHLPHNQHDELIEAFAIGGPL